MNTPDRKASIHRNEVAIRTAQPFGAQEIQKSLGTPESEWVRKWGKAKSAQKRGLLPHPSEVTCERCKSCPSAHKHHEDYSKPLEVQYLCIKCHKARHAELGWGIGGRKLGSGRIKIDFSYIPVGTFDVFEGLSMPVASAAAAQCLRHTGCRFKCFAWGKDKVVVFKTFDPSQK